MTKKEALFYIIAQFIGALLASVSLKFIFPESLTLGSTLPSGDLLQSFLLEYILTFFLMLTILGVTSKKEFSTIAGLLIGLVVTGIILFAGPISGNLSVLWIYLAAPTLGAITATVIWKMFNKNN